MKKFCRIKNPVSFSFKISTVLLLMGFCIASFPYVIHEYKKEMLLTGVEILVESFEKNTVKELGLMVLKNEDGIKKTEQYKSLKEKLYNISKLSHRFRYTYFATINDKNEIVFLVDNEPDWSSENSVYPGELYEEASDGFYDVFENKKTLLDVFVEDRWGNWVSGLTPIVDDEDIVIVFGADIDSYMWKMNILTMSVIPIILIIICGLFFMDIIFRYEHE